MFGHKVMLSGRSLSHRVRLSGGAHFTMPQFCSGVAARAPLWHNSLHHANDETWLVTNKDLLLATFLTIAWRIYFLAQILLFVVRWYGTSAVKTV